jgi:DNA-binding NarL/FixJ family response regulator
MKTRILLVDDHPLVRAALVRIIARYPDCEVVGEAGDGHEGVRLARELAPDLVLMDITMPGLNGLNACKQIVESRAETNVVLLSMHTGEEYVQRGFEAGAKGYVTKDAAPEELAQAVRVVVAGGKFLSSRVSGQNVEQSHPDVA